MNFAKSPPLTPVTLDKMRGLYTEARPEQLPDGASPLVINCDYIVGSVVPRPGLQSVLSPQGTPPPPTLAGIQNISVSVSAAQVLNSFTTPIPLIPAPGPGLIIVPVSWIWYYHFVTTPYPSSSPTFFLPVGGFGTTQARVSNTQIITVNQALGTSNSDKVSMEQQGTASNFDLPSNWADQPFAATVDLNNAGITGDGTFTVNIQYYVIELATGQIIGGTPSVQSVMANITSSQINNSAATPIQLIPAPGANKIIVVLNTVFRTHFNTTPYGSDTTTHTLGYGTSGANVASTAFVFLDHIGMNATQDEISQATGDLFSNSTPSLVINQPVSYAVESLIGSPGDTTLTVYVQYLILDTVAGTLLPSTGGDAVGVLAPLTSAQMKNAFVTPLALGSPPSSNTLKIPLVGIVQSNFVTTPYTAGNGGVPFPVFGVGLDPNLLQNNTFQEINGTQFSQSTTEITMTAFDFYQGFPVASAVGQSLGWSDTVNLSGSAGDGTTAIIVPHMVIDMGTGAIVSSTIVPGTGVPLPPAANFNYLKTFAEQAGEISTLLLDNTGTMWKEDVVNDEGVIVPIYSAIFPNTFGQSATVDDREFIALSDLLKGTDIPYTYNGTNFDRLSQVGPGAAPSVNFLQSQFNILPAPNGLTQPPADAGVVGTNAAPGFFQAIDWSNAAPTGRSPGNILTIFYAQDAADPLAIVGNIVQLSGMANINGQNPNGTYLIIANGFDFPSGDAGAARYWFAVSTETVNNQFIGGPNNQSGNYQITLATVNTVLPVPNIVVGSQITIVGADIPRWDGTYTVTKTPTSGQFQINSTSLNADVASYQYTLIGGTAPTVGQQVTIIGCTNGPLVNGGSIFNVQNAVITSVSPSSFSTALVGPNINPAAEQGSATTSGTSFNFDPGVALLGSATDAGYQPAIFGNSGGGQILGAGTIAQGIRKVCYSFLTRNGYLTKPSPITTVNIPQGASVLTIGNLLRGPSNVIARVIHLTPANGGNFYNIPEPVIVDVGGVNTTNQSTWLRDNTSNSITLSFSDGVLLAADEIDIQGNNLFETAEVGSSVGIIPYGSRIGLIGEQNKLTNLLNWSFDGGISSGGAPAGWIPDTTNGVGGSVISSPIFGFAYAISSAGQGMITQGAFQDEFQVPIIQASTTYSVRITALLTSGTGALVVDLFDPASGIARGTFTIPAAQLTGRMQIFSGTLLTTPVAPVPTGLLLRLYATGGLAVVIDRVEVFPTEQPNLGTAVTLSYVNNFEAFDQVTGVVDSSVQNQQPVKSAFTLYDTLYLVKSSSLVAVQDNNTTEPEGWTVRMVSTSVGTPSIYGVTTAIDEPESGEQWALIANQNGLFYFDGGQPEKISGEIEKLWKQINWAFGHTIWLKNDIINRRVYVGVPLKTPNQWLPTGIIPDNQNPTTPNVILMLSYKQIQSGAALSERAGVHASAFTGKLLATEITRAWAIWTIASPAAAFITRLDQTAPLFLGNSALNGKVYELVDDFLQDDGVAFAQIYDTYGFVTAEQAQALRLGSVRNMYEYMRVLITGSGPLILTVYPNTLDSPYAHPLLPNLVLPASTDGDVEYPVNETGDRLFLQFMCFAVGAGFYLSRVMMAMRGDVWSPVRGVNR